ncbi:MAG TPA: type VI secretion system tube protein Hcp [Candidatus Acidoferrum sp.]|nr:type VI secretion system tube protein Hcp [Candidatus Acidoferrum sp.]
MSGSNLAPAGHMQAPHFFLKIQEIKGDARPKSHENEIEIVSWSWGQTQSVFPSEARKSGGSVSMRDLQFTAVTGAASSQLLLHCAAAKRLKSAILTCEQDRGNTRHKYLTVTLSNVVISSFDIEGSSGADLPLDRVTLKFTKLEFAFTPLAGGNFTCSWDLSLNTA